MRSAPDPGFSQRLQAGWYAGPPHWLLVPLAALFALVAGARRRAFRLGLLRAVHLPVPVVVVGNLVAGGAGKTPAVLALARALIDAGWRPGILSRGHGGRWRLPALVTPSTSAADCGDEALLLARALPCPVAVARRRVDAGRLLLAEHPDCSVLVCDDGLQHYALARDVELVVVDGARGFGNGWLLPAGPLREPVARLAGVQGVLVQGAAAPPLAERAAAWRATAARATVEERLARALPAAVPLWRLEMTMQAPRSLADGAVRDWPLWRGARAHAVAGIGHPGRFFAGLRAQGVEVREHAFPDHHAYTPGELAFEDDDPVLVTTKDAVKLAPPDSTRCWVVPWSARLPAGFMPWLLELLENARGRKDP